MTTATKMYETYPSFFSSTNKYKSDVEINNLHVLSHSFPISKFTKEIIFIIAEHLPAKPLVNLRTTSSFFLITLAEMPKMKELQSKIEDRMRFAFLQRQEQEKAREVVRLDRRANRLR
jgi:hypothetical protein